MGVLLDIVTVVYIVAMFFITLFTSSFGILLLIYLFTRHKLPTCPSINDNDLCSVTIQIPVYNEANVIERVLDACVALDYPRAKLHIQILDDSNDYTVELIQEKIHAYHKQGIYNISHIRRANRSGYKAGALSYGMQFITTDCVAIFDSDFVPATDFLKQTMPYFYDNPRLGLIQTRWTHLNIGYNLLTRAQALNIDGHFAIEQVARNRGQLPMSMNGTGGIWRVQTICDSGGWSANTLTEDLDLSYRAQMQGWEFLYLVDVTVPGELPPQVQAYKRQQARWATGSTECLIRHVKPLLRSNRHSWIQKWMGTMHLSQYAVQPIILLIFLLTPILLVTDQFSELPDLRLLPLTGMMPIAIIALSQIELYGDWHKRLIYFPIQFMTGVAIVLNNSKAVLQAFIRPNKPREFKRTPKFHLINPEHQWRTSRYALSADQVTWGELILAIYAIWGVAVAIETLPAFAPYMLSYAVSFIFFAGWNLYQNYQQNKS